jgi:plasmid stabilization system protein ParE
MVYEFEILDRVKFEIFDGFNWYESKRVDLGSEFIKEIEATIEHIKNYPKHFQIKHQNKYREEVLKRFPYIIIYQIIERKIIVLAVFPSKDNPNKKLRYTF